MGVFRPTSPGDDGFMNNLLAPGGLQLKTEVRNLVFSMRGGRGLVLGSFVTLAL
jgi:hypothetical protein